MPQIKLSSDLERALLRSVIDGLCPSDILSPEELSREGKQVLRAVSYLLNHGARVPLKPASVLLAATSQGAEKNDLKGYLRSFQNLDIGKDAAAIARAARNKETLVNLVNEAGQQLAEGRMDPLKLSGILEKTSRVGGERMVSLAEEVKRFGDPPRGWRIESLPRLTKMLNGIAGVWTVGGEPGLGKSTLAYQIALDLSSNKIPAAYWDLDGTGREYFIDRARRIVGGSIKKFKQMTEYFYLKENIRTLDSDLMSLKPPALLVIDSIQTLPTSAVHRRTSLDKWLGDFKEISKRGYAILLVSEVGRSFYGRIGMGSYKESGGIEYAGSTCLQLEGDPSEIEEPIGVHVLKARHAKVGGHILDLERDPKKEFWFREVDVVQGDRDLDL